jgi:hypothetical protein
MTKDPFSDRDNPQNNWHALIQSFYKGDPLPEDASTITDEDFALFNQQWDEAQEQARKYLASRLREAADTVEREKGCNPGVYGCSVPPPGGRLVPNILMEIGVTLSYPWGG